VKSLKEPLLVLVRKLLLNSLSVSMWAVLVVILSLVLDHHSRMNWLQRDSSVNSDSPVQATWSEYFLLFEFKPMTSHERRRLHQILQAEFAKSDLSPYEMKRLADWIFVLSQKFQIDPALILSMIRVESHFDIDAESSKGALGLMQITPIALKHMGGPQADEEVRKVLLDPKQNIEFGVRYLALLKRQFSGRINDALMAYNVGPGWIARWNEGERGRLVGVMGAGKKYLSAIHENWVEYQKKVIWF
jgi:soluble lytic murein transglycosylase-like protein